MKYCSNKDMNRIIKQLVNLGWGFRSGRKHRQLIHPNGRPKLTVSKSPSDTRALLNFRSDVRRVSAL